jgi:hypothetical protein
MDNVVKFSAVVTVHAAYTPGVFVSVEICKFLRIRIPRFKPDRGVNKWLPIWADPEKY